MKRLLKISSSKILFSILPVVGWLLLGITLDGNLVNVFSLTYPVQCVWGIFLHLFGTGANIKQAKEKDDSAVCNGMFCGIIFGGIVFALFAIFIEPYITFMNMDVAVYKDFALYSVIQLYIVLIFGFVMEKYYFEGKENKALVHQIVFNILNVVVLVGTSLITKNNWIIIGVTLAVIGIYVVALLCKNFHKFKPSFNFMSNIKYQSVPIIDMLLFFLIYFFGLSNAFSYGEEYLVAINFVTLVTDAQWDSVSAIDTVAEIDLTQNKFNYKQHMKNAFALCGIFIFMTITAFYGLFFLFGVNVVIGTVLLALHIFDFLLYPFSALPVVVIQLEGKVWLITLFALLAKVLRLGLSWLPTPYCTLIAQDVETIFYLIAVLTVFYKSFKINKDGSVSKTIKVQPQQQLR